MRLISYDYDYDYDDNDYCYTRITMMMINDDILGSGEQWYFGDGWS